MGRGKALSWLMIQNLFEDKLVPARASGYYMYQIGLLTW